MTKRDLFRTPRISHPADRSHYPFLLLPVILLWLFSAWLAFDYGRERAGFDSGEAADQMAKVRGELKVLWRERDQLKRQIAALENEKKIRDVMEAELQQAMKQQQNERLALEKKLLFLRGAKSGGFGQTLLQVRDLRTRVDSATDEYHLGFTITQAMKKQASISGDIRVSLKGVDSEGKNTAIPIQNIRADGDQAVMKFEQFQKIDWAFKLPEGFVPDEWIVELIPSTTGVKRYKESFQWKTSE